MMVFMRMFSVVVRKFSDETRLVAFLLSLSFGPLVLCVLDVTRMVIQEVVHAHEEHEKDLPSGSAVACWVGGEFKICHGDELYWLCFENVQDGRREERRRDCNIKTKR